MRKSATLTCVAIAFALLSGSAPAAASRSGAVNIAVFPFELEDVTPSGSYGGELPGSRAATQKALQAATRAARRELASSGLYRIVSVSGVDAKPLRDHTLRNCGGCEAGIARKLGAQESMLGIVRRATQTDYYIVVVIRDVRTGKVINEQEANFAGGEEGWANGAKVLIMYQVLPR